MFGCLNLSLGATWLGVPIRYHHTELAILILIETIQGKFFFHGLHWLLLILSVELRNLEIS